MLTITFIRHGESTDNLLPIWAGWRDSPLSEHGKMQARALGRFFAGTRFDTIYASPLKRAMWTAEAVLQHQPEPKPPLHTSLLLREQTRGIAEGYSCTLEPIPGLTLEEQYARGIFPAHHERWQKFPRGESLDDLQQRAEQAVQEIIVPYARAEAQEDHKDKHLAIASHGLLIAEMISALLRLNGTAMEHLSFKGMLNTAWTRVVMNTVPDVLQTHEGEGSVVTRVTDFNKHEHLDCLAGQSAETIAAAERDSMQTYSDHRVVVA